MEIKELVGEFDARIWAKEFIKVIKNNPNIIIDEDLMLGWFANAIMAGYDKACRSQIKEIQIKNDVNLIVLDMKIQSQKLEILINALQKLSKD